MIASTTGKVTLAGSNMVKPIAIGLSVALVTTSLGYFGTSAFISNKLGKRESLHVAQSMNSESEGGIEQSSEEFENNDDMQYMSFSQMTLHGNVIRMHCRIYFMQIHFLIKKIQTVGMKKLMAWIQIV